MEPEYSLSAYRIFNTVAENGNFCAAAGELSLSQPAVSRAVCKLEKSLKVRLFDRNPRGVTLTKEGELLYEHTKQAFYSLSKAEASIKQSSAMCSGPITIGSSTYICESILIPYISKYRAQHPDVSFRINCQSVSETVSLTESKMQDLGICESGHFPDSLTFHPLCKCQEVLVCTPSLISGQDISGLFNNNPLYVPNERSGTLTALETYLSNLGVRISSIQKLDSPQLLRSIAASGLGICLMFDKDIQKELSNGTLVSIQTGFSFTPRTFGFISSRKEKLYVDLINNK